MIDKLQRIIDLANKTGDNIIILDKNNSEPYVLLSLEKYERLAKKCNCPEYLTEDELVDKINRDVDFWQNDQEEYDLDDEDDEIMEFLEDDEEIDEEEDEEDEYLDKLFEIEDEDVTEENKYLEQVEEQPLNMEAVMQNIPVVDNDSFDSVADVLDQKEEEAIKEEREEREVEVEKENKEEEIKNKPKNNNWAIPKERKKEDNKREYEEITF